MFKKVIIITSIVAVFIAIVGFITVIVRQRALLEAPITVGSDVDVTSSSGASSPTVSVSETSERVVDPSTDAPPDIQGDFTDTDGDGLYDSTERLTGTDPTKADTDDDGLSDGEEVNRYCTNPLDSKTHDGKDDAVWVDELRAAAEGQRVPYCVQ